MSKVKQSSRGLTAVFVLSLLLLAACRRGRAPRLPKSSPTSSWKREIYRRTLWLIFIPRTRSYPYGLLRMKSNLEQVVTALAATRPHISNPDYALLDPRLLPELNIKERSSASNRQAMGRRYTQIFADEKKNQRSSAFICVQNLVSSVKNLGCQGVQAIASGRIEPTKLQESIRGKIKGITLCEF